MNGEFRGTRYRLTESARKDIEGLSPFARIVYRTALDILLMDPSNEHRLIRDMARFEIDADAVFVNKFIAIWFDRLAPRDLLIKGVEWRGPDA